LVNADFIREVDVIFHLDVPGQRGAIRKNAVVFQDAVVGKVDRDHQKIPGAHARRLAFSSRAMDRDVLANSVLIADHEAARLAFKFHILRLAPEGGVLVNAIPLAHRRVALDDRVGANFASGADFDVVFDDDVRADFDIGRKLRARAHNRGRMNRHGNQS